MINTPLSRSLVVNWNSPELNQLALALARSGELASLVRPYVNQGRTWERALAAVPVGRSLVQGSFGRRQLIDAALQGRVLEAGVLPDLLAAVLARSGWIGERERHRWTHALFALVRKAVATKAGQEAAHAGCVVAYEGFALEAFRALRTAGTGRAVLSYPVAHHRHRRKRRLQELEREPEFASTWPDFDDWPAGHEERLDEEIALADCVLLGSGYARHSFVQQGVAVDKLTVVPYGADLSLFHPASPARRPEPHAFEAVFAGQLTQRKGLSYLLRGWQRFARPGARLTLIGAVVGDSRPLERHAGGCVHLPHLTRPALAERLRAADVFVFPTLVEGMPLVVVEAMACGLPVIATANGPDEIVRDGVDGFLIPECDAEAVCDRLDRLHRDRELCAWMGANAAARAREFGWDAYAAGARRALMRCGGG